MSDDYILSYQDSL